MASPAPVLPKLYNFETSETPPPPHDAPKLVWHFPADGQPSFIPADSEWRSQATSRCDYETETLFKCSYEKVGTMLVLMYGPADPPMGCGDSGVRNKFFPAAQGDVFVYTILQVGHFKYDDDRYDPSHYPMGLSDAECDELEEESRDIQYLPIPPELMQPVCEQLMLQKYTLFNVYHDVLVAVFQQLIRSTGSAMVLGCTNALHDVPPALRVEWSRCMNGEIAQLAVTHDGIELVLIGSQKVPMCKSFRSTLALVRTLNRVSMATLGLPDGEMERRMGLKPLMEAARRTAERVGDFPVDARVPLKQAAKTMAIVWALKQKEAVAAATAPPPAVSGGEVPSDVPSDAERAADEARRRRAKEAREAKAREGPTPYSVTMPQLGKERAVGRARTAEEERQHAMHVDPAEKAARAAAFDEKQAAAHAEAVERKAREKANDAKKDEAKLSKEREAKRHVVPPPATITDAVALAQKA